MYYENSLTKKEIFIGLGVLIFSLAMAFLFEPFARNGLLKNIRKYELALKVTNSSEFQYASETQVGDVLAYGEMVANEPVSFDELKYRYSLISKVKERYTMHQYITCTTTDKVTSCTTHTYYSWDIESFKNVASADFNFLGRKFYFSDLNLGTQETLKLNKDTMFNIEKVKYDYLYEKNPFWWNIGDFRYYYRITPYKFNCSVFVRFFDNKTSDPIGSKKINVFYERKINDILQEKQKALSLFDWYWFGGFTILLTGTYLIWAYEYADIE